MTLSEIIKTMFKINKLDLLNEREQRIINDDNKQNILVSGENIKTINNESVLGQGNLVIPAEEEGE